MSGFTIAWLVWGLAFAAIELPAVFNKTKGDTLSEHIWKWFAVKDKPTGYLWRRFSLVVALGLLVPHLFGLI